MFEIKYFQCDSSVPTNEEIESCIQIAKEHSCEVVLRWTFPHSGEYSLAIRGDDTLEECLSALPESYPI